MPTFLILIASLLFILLILTEKLSNNGYLTHCTKFGILEKEIIMGIWFWFILAFVGFAFITLIRKWHDQALLYTIAIGFAINANIFNAFSSPIQWGL